MSNQIFEIESDLNEVKIGVAVERYLYVKVGNIDIRIKAEDEGVVVDLHPNKSTDPEPLATTYLHYSEAAAFEDHK